VATFAPPCGENCPTGTGAHAQAKPMRLSPPAIVGLKRALAQGQHSGSDRATLAAKTADENSRCSSSGRSTADPRRYGRTPSRSNCGDPVGSPRQVSPQRSNHAVSTAKKVPALRVNETSTDAVSRC
jgi:hypothetical protein